MRAMLRLLSSAAVLPALLAAAACAVEGEEEEDCTDSECTVAPDPICVGDIAITYATPGTCQLDACSYAATPVDCDQSGEVCVDGECLAPPDN